MDFIEIPIMKKGEVEVEVGVGLSSSLLPTDDKAVEMEVGLASPIGSYPPPH